MEKGSFVKASAFFNGSSLDLDQLTALEHFLKLTLALGDGEHLEYSGDLLIDHFVQSEVPDNDTKEALAQVCRLHSNH